MRGRSTSRICTPAETCPARLPRVISVATGVPYVLAPNGTAPRIERRRLAKRIFDVVDRADGSSTAPPGCWRSPTPSAAIDAAWRRSRRHSLIPNPVDLDEFTSPIARGLFRQRFGLAHRAARLFLGKITPRKRLDVLVRAFARLRSDARLVIAGNDMGARRRRARARPTLGIERAHAVHRPAAGQDRLEALADADVLVYPSQDEIFGLVPLEALLSGTPVIVADDSGCGEVVQRDRRRTGGAARRCGRAGARHRRRAGNAR